jgi:DNA-binding MarR family transcriptional regulator
MERYHRLIPEQWLGRWHSMLHRIGTQFYSRRFKSQGIGRGQFFVLAALLEKDGTSQDDLAGSLHIDKGTVAKAMRTMENNGLIIRTHDPRNRRIKRIQLTAKAEAMKEKLQKAQNDWTEILVQGLTPAERRQAFYLLYRMAANAEAWLKKAPGTD